MKRLLLPLLLSILLFSVNEKAVAQTTSCQDITVQLDGTGNYSFSTPLTPQTDTEVLTANGATTVLSTWQSFTPTVSGVLDAIEVTFATLPISYVDVVIRDGQGLAAPAIYAQTFTPTVVGSPTTIDIISTLDLTAGNEYTIDLQPSSACQIRRNSTNPYAGGISSLGAGTDLHFSVDILQRPTIDNGSTDSDGIDHWELSQTDFACGEVGDVDVTLTVHDKLGNSNSCMATVTVEDNIDPVAACVPWSPGTQVVNNYSDSPNLAIPDGDPSGVSTIINVTDNFIPSDLNVNLSIDHTYVGDLVITLTHDGNTAVLLDRMGVPVSTFGCGDDNIDVTVDDAAGSALEDACTGSGGPVVGTFTGVDMLSIFNSSDVNGDWTLFISDNANYDNGTIVEWSIDATEDITPATYAQFALDGTGNYTVDPLNDIDDGSSDNCGVTLTTSPTSFSCADVGIQSIILTATDPSGNATNCTTQVEIIDNLPPTALCQDITVALDGNGEVSIVPGDIDNGSTDNCTISSLSLDILDFDCSNLGGNTVVLTVEDVNGNTSDCSATVTVEDNQDPVITCSADIVVCSESASGATVNYAAATGTDNCDFVISQTDLTGLTNGDVFPIGVTNQEWTIVDDANNSVSCSFTVTVNATPDADYEFSPACQGESIFFSDLSTIDVSSSIIGWSWDMDDGSASIGIVDPIHQYADTGMYVVQLVVESTEGCTDTSEQVVHVTPVPSAAFTVVEACEGNATVFTNASSIVVGDLNYEWDFGDGSPVDNTESPSYIYPDDGTFTVTLTVTSDDGCQDVATASVTILDSPTALFVATTECEGVATTFSNLTTGTGVITYSWDFGDGNTSTDTAPTNLYTTAGDYTVTLTATNDDGCENVSSALVTVNGLPNVGFTFSDVCEGTAVDFVNTSDAGTCAWNLGDGSSSSLSDVFHAYTTFGTFDVTLTVTDANFCINSLTQQIEIFDLPDFTLDATDVLCFGEATGIIEIVDAGSPAAPWSMSLNGETPQSVSVFYNDRPAGSYEVVVVDTNLCEFSAQTTIDQPTDTLGVVLNNIDDNLCNGDDSGNIAIQGSGGTSPYTYQLDGGSVETSGLFSGLEAGTHDLQIVDANLCVFDTTITLTEPDALILGLVESHDLLCNGDFSGWMTVLGTGGVMPYEYNLDGGTYEETASFSGLSAGTYIVGVMDANGCMDTVHVTLAQPGILQLSLIASDSALCFGAANGFMETAAASGTPPYQYSLDGINYQGDSLFQGLSAGTHTVTVMDANGCLDEVTETIFEPSQLTIETSSVPAVCFGDENGEIQITGNGGTLGLEYSIDGGDSFYTNDGTFTNLPSGNYLAVVEDSHGCSTSEGVSISEPSSAFSLNEVITNVGCLGDSTGSVLLVGSGGTPTYTYSNDNISFVTPNTFGSYPIGSYTFYGQDLNGCVDSVEVVIEQPATSLTIASTVNTNPACPNEDSGTITVHATGGTLNYIYSANGGLTSQAGQILSGLGGGNHLVVVTDANGCVASDSIELVSPALLSLDIDSLVGVDCEGDVDGEIHITATGGTPSYDYSLNSGSIQSNGDFINLIDGDYEMTIVDVNGCSFSETIEVPAALMQPIADFSFYIIAESVLFTNESMYTDSALWDFGDGSTSNEESPTHVYDQPGNYNVVLTVYNDCGSSSITIYVSTINTGIETEELTFGLFPNPTSNEVFVLSNRSVENDMSIEVVSTSGQLIKTMHDVAFDAYGRYRVDLNGLMQGIYYLRIQSEKEQSVLRFDIIK